MTKNSGNTVPANVPSNLPSLARAFEGERTALRQEITNNNLDTTKAVAAARRALDRTGTAFVTMSDDVQLQKAGLWLVEMVKTGAVALDRGTDAQIVWREVPSVTPRQIAGSTLFYSASLLFFIAGMVQGSRLTMLSAVILAALRFFDPKDWKAMLRKIPILGRRAPKAITGPDGASYAAEAQIGVKAGPYVDGILDALKTADHLLLRYSERDPERHWHDDPRLLDFIQSLLEASSAGDKGFAFKLIGAELDSLLAQEGIQTLDYNRKSAEYFDVLPGLDMDGDDIKQAAPALVIDGEVVKRGTVWKP